MFLTITLNDKEMNFIKKMAEELGSYAGQEKSPEDAIHECINMAMYDESEETAQEEGM